MVGDGEGGRRSRGRAGSGCRPGPPSRVVGAAGWAIAAVTRMTEAIATVATAVPAARLGRRPAARSGRYRCDRGRRRRRVGPPRAVAPGGGHRRVSGSRRGGPRRLGVGVGRGVGVAARGRTAATRRRWRLAGSSGPGCDFPRRRAAASACATARPTPRRRRRVGRRGRFQNADWARWPPQAITTAEPFDVNFTRNSAVLLPCRAGVRRAADRRDRAAPDGQAPRDAGYARPRTVRPSALNGSDGNAAELDDGIPRAHRRDRRHRRTAHRWLHPAVVGREEVVRLVAARR